MPTSPRRFLLALLAVQAALVGLAAWRDPAGGLPGDAGFYAAAAHSLVYDRDLDLLNQCRPAAGSLADALPTLQGELGGEFGLGARGELTLKQSPVLAAAAAPFYAALGRPGFTLFNVLALTALLAGVAALAGDRGGRLAALLLLLTTPVRRFVFDLSPDVFLCALLVGGLLAARSRRPGVCGLCLGLAAGAKVYVIVLAVPVALVAVAAARPRWRAALVGVAGGLVGLAPAAGFNAYQYGAPWVTGYERQLHVSGTTIGVAGHATRFTEPPLNGVRNILFDPTVGLVPTAPLLVLSVPAGGYLAVRRRLAGWPAGAVGVGLLNVAVFAGYDGWHGGSAAGNRYLFPAVVCGFALTGHAAELAWESRRAGRAGAAAAPAEIPGETPHFG